MILAFSAFFSFVIATFINEIQGSGNAIKKLGLNQDQVSSSFQIIIRYNLYLSEFLERQISR